MINKKQLIVVCISVFLMIVFLIMGITWNGQCIGDSVFLWLGVKAWSNGTQGIHYTVVCSLVAELACVLLLTSAIKNNKRFWLYTGKVFCAIILLTLIINIVF